MVNDSRGQLLLHSSLLLIFSFVLSSEDLISDSFVNLLVELYGGMCLSLLVLFLSLN